MSKSGSVGPWTCPRCLRLRPRQSQRASVTFSSIATRAQSYTSTSASASLVDHTNPSKSYDDATLRAVFDSKAVWHEFSRAKASHLRGGLFGNAYLKDPEGFQSFATTCLTKAQKVVDRVLRISTVQGYRRIVYDMDYLSDLLCRVIDIADFVRATHPDLVMRNAAASTHEQMFEYMNVLNTNPGLNDQLKAALATPEVVSSWSEEELVVARILEKDFANSAINMPSAQRQRFVDLSGEISQLGADFVGGMETETPVLRFDSTKLKGLDPRIIRRAKKWNVVEFPTVGAPAIAALRQVEDEETRREVYTASRTSSRQQVKLLEEMLRMRGELARLSKHDSFGHMALGDKMAKSPTSVDNFLRSLLQNNKARAHAELENLRKIKSARRGNTEITAWDREYYQARLLESHRQYTPNSDTLAAYFSLGTVMQGLSRLFDRLYGVRLVPRETLPGETWNSEVRRLDAIDSEDGHVAVIYCDLFERHGKSPNPTHFTLRCSRRISEDEIGNATSEISSVASAVVASAIEAATDAMASARDRNGDLYQLPTIALICDFSAASAREPTLLSFRDVQTLFHEMGHALHSVLGRTRLQNVAGTRCATDLAELPSVLMEHFASAPEVLQLFARHWETDAPLNYDLIKAKTEIDRLTQGTEVELQILMAMLDQQLHSEKALSPSFDSTNLYQDLFNEHGMIPEPPTTSWQGLFGHLYGYGATYYSYLFDQAIAKRVWKDVFQKRQGGALDEEAGQTLKNELLRWGGARDGWKCVAGVLNDPSLEAGDAYAMKRVGETGIANGM